MDPISALPTLGALLAERGQRFDIAVIGGAGLLIAGLLSRATSDIDAVAIVEDDRLITADPLPEPLQVAIEDVARIEGLDPAWLNSAPGDLLRLGLPQGFLTRTSVHIYGGLTLRVSSRIDQVHFKLYAAVDREPGSKHEQDLRLLEPTASELGDAAAWCQTHDPSPAFAAMLEATLERLRAN